MGASGAGTLRFIEKRIHFICNGCLEGIDPINQPISQRSQEDFATVA